MNLRTIPLREDQIAGDTDGAPLVAFGYDAIQLHVEGLVADNLPVPLSTSFAEYVVVPA